MPDWDSLLAYQTVKVVRIKDRRLGFLYYFLIFSILVYIGVFVFGLNRGYLEVQYTTGTVATKVKGTAVSVDTDESYFDEADLVVPALEAQAIFLITRVQHTASQERGWCLPEVAYRKQCTNDSACVSKNFPRPGKCNAENLCEFYQWCPDEEDDETVPSNTTVTRLDGVTAATMWFKASIRFDQLGDKDEDIFFSTIQQSTPVDPSQDPARANLYSLQQLIDKLPESSRKNTTSMLTYGAILGVTLRWQCDITRHQWDIAYDVRRFDNPQLTDGFNYRTASYYTDINGVPRRDLWKYYGIRLFVESVGQGTRVSVVQIVLNIASGLALVGIATLVTDLLMLSVGNQKDAYRQSKVEETEVLYQTQDYHVMPDSPAK
eukprot:TRINITY_DN25273_c0_g1_i2.p1 TRINITY_DN25273_c0_g1~~TRINITY_DN25273_c0_g1_i2.p1  ORF type:complete len:377 (+),score=80.61 TRINITY_DN25273_c0_g1_i2:1195-2325(+)